MCCPTDRSVVCRVVVAVSWPASRATGEPTFVPSTENCTVPPPGEGLTRAVAVTDAPCAADVGDSVSEVVVADGGVSTTNVNAVAVLAELYRVESGC